MNVPRVVPQKNGRLDAAKKKRDTAKAWRVGGVVTQRIANPWKPRKYPSIFNTLSMFRMFPEGRNISRMFPA